MRSAFVCCHGLKYCKLGNKILYQSALRVSKMTKQPLAISFKHTYVALLVLHLQ
jgi:hypothetical protein